ncbi:hypothetical protein GCM10025734_04160 [Kitasatospora paranensis]
MSEPRRGSMGFSGSPVGVAVARGPAGWDGDPVGVTAAPRDGVTAGAVAADDARGVAEAGCAPAGPAGCEGVTALPVGNAGPAGRAPGPQPAAVPPTAVSSAASASTAFLPGILGLPTSGSWYILDAARRAEVPGCDAASGRRVRRPPAAGGGRWADPDRAATDFGASR